MTSVNKHDDFYESKLNKPYNLTSNQNAQQPEMLQKHKMTGNESSNFELITLNVRLCGRIFLLISCPSDTRVCPR